MGGYMPPEAWDNNKWYPTGDVFSMGVVCIQVLTDATPDTKTGLKQGTFVEGARSMEEVAQITKTRQPPFHLIRNPQILQWLQPCLEKMRKARPRAPQVLEMPWFQGVVNNPRIIGATAPQVSTVAYTPTVRYQAPMVYRSA